jgi:D-aspartate ligase
VLLLFSRESRLVAAFTTRKTRQWPVTGGATAASCSTTEEYLVDQVLPFFEKWRWRGSAEVELKLDCRDGRHKVIEINPRFPGYLRFPCECGLDFPVLAVDLALGSQAASPGAYPAYETGARYLNPGLFVRTVASDLRHRRVSQLRHAVGDMRGVGCLVLDVLDDPLPLFGRLLSWLRRDAGREQLFQISR